MTSTTDRHRRPPSARRAAGAPPAAVIAWALALAACAPAAQPPVPATAPASEPASAPAAQAAAELPEAVLAELAQIDDFAFNFDQDGFYALLRFAKTSAFAPGAMQPPLEVRDWDDLLARPRDFRGRPIAIEGTIGRNKAPYVIERVRELGLIGQLEIQAAGQPISCTIVTTEDASDLPVGGQIRIVGYFVMIRQYNTPSGRTAQSALLIAKGPTSLSRDIPAATDSTASLDWRWLLAVAAAAALIWWMIVRSAARHGRRDIRTLRATRAAPLDLSGDLADWVGRQPPPPDASEIEAGDRDGADRPNRAAPDRPDDR